MKTNRLREVREALRLKQTDVARKLGLTSSDRISHWEKGLALPGLLNLFKLSAIYGLSPEQLYPELYRSIIVNIQSGSNPSLVQAKTSLDQITKTP
jgi:transcriptional regulator with XRE-family HTH domain